jgi:mRNA interferase MazF
LPLKHCGSSRADLPKSTEHGEIWWADTDKRRRVVVASRSDVEGRRAQTTVATITTTVRGIPSEVVLDSSDGFSQLCAINCDTLLTVEKVLLERRFGALSGPRLAEFDEALRFALQLR